MRLRVGVVSHRGLVRTGNEDAVLVGPWQAQPHASTAQVLDLPLDAPALVAVADGLGGHARGEVASRYLVQRLAEHGPELDAPEPLCALLQAVHDELVDLGAGNPAYRGTATTLAALLFAGGRAWSVNVGDSRAYRWSHGYLGQVSTDDSPAVGPYDAAAPAVTSVVTQTVGGPARRERLSPHVAPQDVEPGDRWLLATDGLTDLVPVARMEELVTPEPGETAVRLCSAALRAGGRDNISIASVHVLDGDGDR